MTPTRTSALALGSLCLIATLGACKDSGGRATTAGIQTPPSSTLDIDFGMRRDLLLGTSFLGDVLHIDLNGDGFEDLIETNFLPQRMSIALGNPDGTFTSVFQRPTMGHGFRLAVGDINGDLLTDIIIATRNYQGVGTSGVEVILQAAGADFSGTAMTIVTPSDPTDLAVSPSLTGPAGTHEIFAALMDEDEIAILNIQNNALVQTGSLNSSNLGVRGGPFSLAFVDLGADGLMDLVVGETNVFALPDRVIQYRRQGALGGFDAPTLVMSPVFKPNVDAVGDVDSNGFDDIAVAQLEADNVFLLAGDGAGLSQVFSIDFGGRTTSLIFSDLDLDGFAEAIATTFDHASIQMHPGTSPMTWGDPIHYNVGLLPRAISTILLPGDPIPDLLCANISDLSILVGLADAQGIPTGAFRGARGYDTESEGPSAIVLADFNNNGESDVVVVSRTQNTISFMEGMGDGSLETRVVLPMMPNLDEVLTGLATADVDSDGDLDVIATVFALGEIRLYRNEGDFASFVDPLPQDVTAVGGNPVGIAVGDFNNDNMPDLAIANAGDSTIQLLLNQGGGSFMLEATIASPVPPVGMVCADFDLNGNLDLAVVTGSGATHTVDIYEGDGVSSFSMTESHPLDGSSSHMATGDFDQNGFLDIVVGQNSIFGEDVFVLINDEALSFTANRVPVQAGPGTVLPTDIDNDGRLDIVTVALSGELKIVRGNGFGNFGASIPATGEFPINADAVAGVLGDLNGDGLPDLMTISTDTPFVWVAINASVLSEPQVQN